MKREMNRKIRLRERFLKHRSTIDTRPLTDKELKLYSIHLRLLKNHKAFITFVANTKKNSKIAIDQDIVYEMSTNRGFVDRAFIWRNTSQGHSFWQKIHHTAIYLAESHSKLTSIF